MGKVHVRIDTGRKFWLDERIQQAFPDDYVLVEETAEKPSKKKSATAANESGGEKEGDQA